MDCILKPMKLLDCAHIGVCVVIRSNMVFILDRFFVPATSPLARGFVVGEFLVIV